MADRTDLCDLVDRVLNEQLTPEEACSLCPELLSEVRQRVDECRNVDFMLERLFPGSTDGKQLPVNALLHRKLPSLPGYEVLEILGHGGMGIIYRVRHLKLNRVCALKMLLAGEFASQTEIARFMREARAVATLKHQNVVQIYDIGELEGRPYFTMEFMEGGSLAETLRCTTVDFRRASEFISTLAKAIHAAHQAGILHRDLKPGNILLTSDGVPKISDFGLASRFADETVLTGNEARLGTPSYMAPEQAAGSMQGVTSSADIYALGAMLYEMLVGKPPFRGATPLETQRLVVFQEPVSPSRVNPRVPRDLDTVCLKCLRKSPSERYESAAAMAADLDRFLHYEPILARPVGRIERASKWLKRRPGIAASIGLGALLVSLAVADCFWLRSQHAHLELEVNGDLKALKGLELAGQWSDAQDRLHQAEARLAVNSSQDLTQRVSEAQSNLEFASDLDSIRLSRATTCALPFYRRKADLDYETAFHNSLGVDVNMDARIAADRIKASPVIEALVSALDDWSCTVSDPQRRAWILNVARRVDPDPSGWRDCIRDSVKWDDRKAVADLANEVPTGEVPVSTLIVLAERIRDAKDDNTSFLHRVQKEHPADFYASLAIGDSMLAINPAEAGVYYRAALAARPKAPVGYSAVGDSLRFMHKYEDAIGFYNQALDKDHQYARAKCDLAGTLADLGQFREAIVECKESLRLDQNYAWTHYYYGNALRGLGQITAAVDQYAIIYDQAPTIPGVAEAYRSALITTGRTQVAMALWDATVKNPGSAYGACTGYPELCLFGGSTAEYHRTRAVLFERFGSQPDPEIAQQIARTFLLVPTSQEDEADLRNATALINRALTAKSPANWDYPYYSLVKALAEYRNGDPEGALKRAGGNASSVMGPCPKLIAAMALHEQHRSAEATRALADAATVYDWRVEKADDRDQWIYHILRREADTKVLPDLPAWVAGARQPRNNDERIAMLPTCQFQRLDAMCVQTFNDALNAEPDLFDKRNLDVGFVAACASSALSLCHVGDHRDTVKLSTDQLQMLALNWLRAELSAQMRHVPNNRYAREWVAKEFDAWKRDPSLADLRDTGNADNPSSAIHNETIAFWQSLDKFVAHIQQMNAAQAATRKSN